MKKIFILLILVITVLSYAQQSEISLYNGVAPGSESWTWTEQTMGMDGSRILMDVSRPTITPFIPANPNGTAIIVAPGGAFYILSVDNEGIAVARQLNEMGITAFVLKYRAEIQGEMTLKDKTNPVKESGIITVQGQTLTINALFNLTLADYGIAFDDSNMVSAKIGKSVEVTVVAECRLQ